MATVGTYSLVVDGKLNPINNLTNITATYSASLTDSVIHTNFTATYSLTIPLAAQSGLGKKLTITRAGSAVSITPSGSDTISGSGSPTVITQANAPLSLYSDGVSNWFVV